MLITIKESCYESDVFEVTEIGTVGIKVISVGIKSLSRCSIY